MDGQAVELTQWGQIVALASSPLVSLILAFFVWKMAGEMKEMKLSYKELYESIHANGFLKKSDLEEAWKRGDEVHKRHDEAISRLESDVRNIWVKLR